MDFFAGSFVVVSVTKYCESCLLTSMERFSYTKGQIIILPIVMCGRELHSCLSVCVCVCVSIITLEDH